MKTSELKKLIKECVKEAFQEEIRDIVLEAVKSSSGQVIVESKTQPKKTLLEQKNAYMDIMNKMANPGLDRTISMNTSNLVVPPNINTAAEGTALPSGELSLDQIMNLGKKK